MFWPEALGLVETDTDVRFEFRSRDVALQFAAANQTTLFQERT